MKLSISLPDEDVEFLDSYADTEGLKSRSAAVHKAVGLLRGAELDAAYEEAFVEWNEGGDAVDWDVTSSDGLVPDAPG